MNSENIEKKVLGLLQETGISLQVSGGDKEILYRNIRSGIHICPGQGSMLKPMYEQPKTYSSVSITGSADSWVVYQKNKCAFTIHFTHYEIIG